MKGETMMIRFEFSEHYFFSLFKFYFSIRNSASLCNVWKYFLENKEKENNNNKEKLKLNVL